jgi:hypothetical protein
MSINAEISDAVKNIVREYGEPILQNRKRLKSMLADYLPDVSKEEREAALEEITSGNVDFFARPPLSEISSETQPDSVPLSSYEEKVKEVEELKTRIAEMNTGNMQDSAIQLDTPPKAELTQENQPLAEPLGKIKTGLTIAILIAVIGIIGWIATGTSNSDRISDLEQTNRELNNKLNSFESEKMNLTNKLNSLQTEYNALMSIASVRVTSIKVGNWGNSRWINNPGETLYSSQMRYLSPVITYDSFIDESVVFFVKIIDPDGDIYRNLSTSPAGYSFSSTGYISRGSGKSLDLSGWGSSDRSTYYQGTWTVEVWYNNVCLRSELIRIN